MRERRHFCLVNPNAGSCIIKTDMPAGGAERQIVALASGLVASGHKVSILTRLSRTVSSIQHDGVEWVHVPFDYLQGHRAKVLFDWAFLWRRLEELHPDFVLLKQPRHLLGLLAAWGGRNRSSVFFHAAIDRDCSPRLLAEERLVVRLLYRLGLRAADGVLAQTRAQERDLALLTNARVHYLPSLFPGDSPSSSEDQDRSYFLWVGSNSARKRPHLLLDLARELEDQRFVMLYQPGDGTGGLPPQSAPNNVSFVESCPRESIWGYYAGASATISTSALEGFPNVFLESWACRTPIVSLGSDPDDVLATHKAGRLARSFEDLVRLVAELAREPSLATTLGEVAHLYLREHHLPEVVMPRFLSIMEEYEP